MNKTALISGAGGALGSAVAQKFSKNGYTVHGLYRTAPDKKSVASDRCHTLDLLNEENVRQTVEAIIREEHSIDVLVCAAGGFDAGSMEKTSAEDLEKQYRINFLTAYNLVRPVCAYMKQQQSGAIFLIGSRQGIDMATAADALAYGLSKSLLFGLAEALNADTQGKIVTSVIVPSTIDTPANRQSMPDADFKRWVPADDIAEIILFYSSQLAKHIRQPVIKVYGNG